MNSNKKCFVPNCQSNWRSTPNKLFVKVRDCLKRDWCHLLKIHYNPKHPYHCCEDHLNLEEDLENYYYWKLMNGRPILKPTATLKLNTTEVKPEDLKEVKEEDDEYCELVEEPERVKIIELLDISNETKPIIELLDTSNETKPIIELLDTSNETKPKIELLDESAVNKDPLDITTDPPTVKYMKTLENFKLRLYAGVNSEDPQDTPQEKPREKCRRRKQDIRPRAETAAFKSTSKDLGGDESFKLVNGKKQIIPTKILLNTPHEDVITKTVGTSTESSKPEASVLYKLLLTEDTMAKTGNKLDTPAHTHDSTRTMKATRNAGTQYRVAKRDVCVGFNGRKTVPIGFKKPKPSLIEDGTDVEVLDLTEPCSCCLFRPSDKYLKTTYIDGERSEIYSDMLEKCFGIQIATQGECGICEECAGRLRDALEFKLQVQRSQARLMALRGNPQGEDDLLAACAIPGIDCLDYEVADTPTEVTQEEPPTTLPEMIVRSDGLYECESCRKTFKREAGLRGHILVHYQRAAQETTRSPELDNCENVYTCDDCGEEFCEKTNYNAHVKEHEREPYKPHTSEASDESQDTITNTNSDHETSEDDSSENSDCKYACHLCGNEFTRKRNYVRHLKRHESPFKCDICPREFLNERFLAQHKNRHAGLMYICDMCKKKFYDKFQLTVHIASHMNMKLFSCKVCPKRFKNQYYLQNHQLCHIKEKNYSCGVCNKRFGHESLLSRHELLHRNEPCVCEHCGKLCTSMSSLKAHRRTHTGERPFKCDICQKRFSIKSHLNTHYSSKHLGLRPYACQLCPKKFSGRSYLPIHMLIHSGEKPYKCELCGKKFAANNYLRLHMLVHTGERPHSCQICGKKFGRREHLTRHLDTHKERKYYSCQHCPKVYSNKEGFRQHLRKHEKGLI